MTSRRATMQIDVTATKFVMPAGRSARCARASPERWRSMPLTLAMKSEDLDLSASARGGLDLARESADMAARRGTERSIRWKIVGLGRCS